MTAIQVRVDPQKLQEVVDRLRGFGYEPGRYEIAATYRDRVLTGDQRVAMTAKYTGTMLHKVQRAAHELADMIDQVGYE